MILIYFRPDTKYVFPTQKELNHIQYDNKIAENGEKVGLWHIYYKEVDRVKIKALYFLNDEGKSEVAWTALFGEEGELKEVCGRSEDEGLICVEAEEYLRLMNVNP